MRRALDADVIVVGGGISGLACAWNRQQRGMRVLVLEAGAQAGGSIGTAREHGCLLEAGPNSALDTTPLIARLLKRVFDLDLEHCPQCGGDLKIIAAIEEPAVIVRILMHLGLPARATALTGAAAVSLSGGLILKITTVLQQR